MCFEGSFGDISGNRRYNRGSALRYTSSPFISYLQHICVLGLSTLEQKVNMRSIGYSPNVFDDSQIFLSLFF
uniref:Uncharacterized protein n=1 Tax=Solanum tuberosum TaxID=4113 RepID=M1DHT7_SOLTU